MSSSSLSRKVARPPISVSKPKPWALGPERLSDPRDRVSERL
jgi:hypothetical protein